MPRKNIWEAKQYCFHARCSKCRLIDFFKRLLTLLEFYGNLLDKIGNGMPQLFCIESIMLLISLFLANLFIVLDRMIFWNDCELCLLQILKTISAWNERWVLRHDDHLCTGNQAAWGISTQYYYGALIPRIRMAVPYDYYTGKTIFTSK